jgi:hypothetical protein
VIVADDPTPGQATALAGPIEAVGGVALEVVWTSSRLGRPAALNAGLRRAVGDVVVVLGDGSDALPGGIGPLVEALADPVVAIAGEHGLTTSDLRRYVDSGNAEPTVIGGTLAFRRGDLIARGPIEERFLTARGLETWWSLTLRDEGASGQPRRARAVPGSSGGEVRPAPTEEGSRADRRDYYRLLDGFGGRTDLLATEPSDPAVRPA